MANGTVGRPKGLPKTGGRKPGSASILTDKLKERLKEILLDEFSVEKFPSLFEGLKSSEKVTLINKMLDLVVPKTVEIAESPATQNYFEEIRTELYASFKKSEEPSKAA